MCCFSIKSSRMYYKWTLNFLLLKMDERESIYENIDSDDPHTYITVLGDGEGCFEEEEIYEDVDDVHNNNRNMACGEIGKDFKSISGNVTFSGKIIMKNRNKSVKFSEEVQGVPEKRLSRYISEEEYVTPNVPIIHLEECGFYGNVSDEEECGIVRGRPPTLRQEIESLYGNCVRELNHLKGRFSALPCLRA